MKGKRLNKALPVVMFILGGIFCISSIQIGNYLWDAHKSNVYAEKLQEIALEQTAEKTDFAEKNFEEAVLENGDALVTDGLKETEIPQTVDFEELKKISPNVRAWIYSPGTRINNVIAQATDDDYYLHRMLDGTEAKAGTLFMEYLNTGDFSDWNTLIYGHHMKNGTMFASLVNYQNREYYEKHPVMYLYLPGACYRLEVIAGYTTGTEDRIYMIPQTAEEKQELVSYVIRKSDFTADVTVEEEDRLVTLSTCSYRYNDARYVVIAKIAEE